MFHYAKLKHSRFSSDFDRERRFKTSRVEEESWAKMFYGRSALSECDHVSFCTSREDHESRAGENIQINHSSKFFEYMFSFKKMSLIYIID